jgi:hypothetical protein
MWLAGFPGMGGAPSLGANLSAAYQTSRSFKSI